jgi:hypothetical protein
MIICLEIFIASLALKIPDLRVNRLMMFTKMGAIFKTFVAKNTSEEF